MTTYSWQNEIFIGMIIASVFLPFHFRKRTGTVAAILWAYCLISSLAVFMNPEMRYGSEQFRLNQTAGQAFAIMAILPIFICSLSGRYSFRLLCLFELYAVVSALMILVDGPNERHEGIIGVSSFDACVIASVFPMLAFRPDPKFKMMNGEVRSSILHWIWSVFSLVTCFAAIVYAKGAMAIFGLAIGLFIYAFLTRRYWAIFASSAALTAGYLTQFHELFNPTDRFQKWKFFMDWWYLDGPKLLGTAVIDATNPMFGTGFGTFNWIGPLIQGEMKNNYLWMHSDPLQVLFEGGIVGFGLAFAVGVVAVFKAWNRPWLVATIAATFTMTLAQFPLRFFSTALLILLLVHEAINDFESEVTWRKF